MSKTVKIDCYGIVIELIEPELHSSIPTRYGCGSISSNMKCSPQDSSVEEERLASDYNIMIDAIESIILAHACAGIDVDTPAYIEGIETACNACAKATE